MTGEVKCPYCGEKLSHDLDWYECGACCAVLDAEDLVNIGLICPKCESNDIVEWEVFSYKHGEERTLFRCVSCKWEYH